MLEARPRVLLVDDHRPFLDAVSSMLSARDFDVAGATTDGFHAVEMASRLLPDVIVLDVDMPRLDGYQTARAIRQSGLLTTPIVFLSMHEADDFVGEAFRHGAKGYVLKSRVGRDLVNALDQAAGGRMFAPSLTSLFHLTGGTGHAMQLHASLDTFVDDVAGFFDLSLQRGDAACIFATESVRDGVADRLQRRGWTAGSSERLLVIDAVTAVQRIMRDGLPQRESLAEIAAELDQFRLAVTGSASSRLTIFGNAVEVLSEDGNVPAMLALERLWNSVTEDLPFFTLCGYSTACFTPERPDLWPCACAEHRVLSHTADI